MRTVSRIFLVSLYLTVTVGVTVASHFCDGTLVSSGLVSAPLSEPQSCCADDEQMSRCCFNAVVSLVVSDDHTATGSWSAGPLPVQELLPPPITVGDLLNTPLAEVHATPSPPPGTPPLTLLNCTLLI